MSGPVFPVGLTLHAGPVAVSGDNAEAWEKIERLTHAGAGITLYAPDIRGTPGESLAGAGKVIHVPRWLAPADVGRYRLVLSTRLDPAYSTEIAAACRAAGVIVNCYDNPAASDFAMPAVMHSGKLQIAVFTGGSSPALARKIRLAFERIFDDRFASFLDALGALRERLRRDEPDAAKRRESLLAAVEGFEIEGLIKYPDKDHGGSP